MSPEKRGRPRAFDSVAALEKALAVFLRQGYDAASLDDLTKAMGINRPSLYAAFGSKSALYNAALRHYAARSTDHIMAELRAADDIVTGAQSLLREWAKKMSTGCEGCLVVASASQCGRHAETGDASIEDTTRQIMSHLSFQLQACFAAAQKRGRLKADVDPRALAHYIAGLIQGLTVFGRTSGNANAVHDMAEVACAFLETLRV